VFCSVTPTRQQPTPASACRVTGTVGRFPVAFGVVSSKRAATLLSHTTGSILLGPPRDLLDRPVYYVSSPYRPRSPNLLFLTIIRTQCDEIEPGSRTQRSRNTGGLRPRSLGRCRPSSAALRWETRAISRPTNSLFSVNPIRCLELLSCVSDGVSWEPSPKG
jgi:hypothetical protein